MKYFKVKFGYDAEDAISIDETELEAAQYAHMTKKTVLLKHGSLSGDKITAIVPDYHRAMGWPRGYKLRADDYAEISDRGCERAHLQFLARNKERLTFLIASGRQAEIGKNVPLPELEKTKEVSKLSAGLTEQMSLSSTKHAKLRTDAQSEAARALRRSK